MNEEGDWKKIFEAQKKWHNESPLDYKKRLQLLKSLRESILSNEDEINKALKEDLNKTDFEIYGSEIGLVLQEIRYVLKNLREWLRPKSPNLPLSHWPAKAKIIPQPFGLVLIIVPWNYPIQLTFLPLVSAIAAGNSVHIKLSEKSPASNKIIHKIINEVFDQKRVSCSEIEGPKVAQKIINATRFDKIFFTGGAYAGTKVYQEAAKNLIPVSLELGGKSPAVVDGTSNLKIAAKRIVWAKILNAGQSCIAPDYLLVQNDCKDELLKQLKNELERVFSLNSDKTRLMAKLIDSNKFEELQEFCQYGNVYYSGESIPAYNWFHPTIITDLSWDDPPMKKEIFGPLLPVMCYSDKDDLLEKLSRTPNPLAFYLFSSNSKLEKQLVEEIPFGGGGSNMALMQIASPKLPHGGIAESGLGTNHGKYGFQEFCHQKVWHKTWKWPDIPIRYAPFGENKLKLLKRILR